MREFVILIGSVAFVAFAPLVYTTFRTISLAKLRDTTFAKTLAKDYLRTLPACALVLIPALAVPVIVPVYALVLHLLFFPLLFLELGHVLLFRTRIGLNTFYSLFVSNMRETKEFVAQNIPWTTVVLFAVLYALPPFFLVRLPSPAFAAPWIRWTAVAAAAALALPFVLNLLKPAGKRKDGYVMNPFTNAAYHYFLSRRNYRELKGLIAAHDAPPFENISSRLPAGTRETYVVVIGESANAQHLGCYGYGRDTTEFTDRLGDEMIRIAGVRAPFAQTIPSLEKVLTFADNDHAELVFSKGSIIDWFNDAGFKTYWYSNQYALDDTALTAMTAHATVSKCFNFSGMKRFERAGLDGDMLPDLRKLLANGDLRKVVFVHLIGSHSAYVNRYPDEFNVFTGQAPGRSLSSAKQQFLNAYDNSIRYTDWTLSEIVAALKSIGGVSYMLYFSDHGEDIYDSTDARIMGHGPLANEPMTSVPFMLWLSAELDRLRPDIRSATATPDYPLMDAIHTLIDISSLDGPDYNPAKSVFSQKS